MEITVNTNDVDHALRVLKKKMQREGIYRDMKLHRHFEKPSERKARKRVESLRRARKMSRKRFERDGF
jgi:small subunit ribosomal protein S21